MQNIINGKWVDASDGSVMKIVNPYNGRTIDTVPNATKRDVNRAVTFAKKAQEKWEKVPVYQKVEILKKLMAEQG